MFIIGKVICTLDSIDSIKSLKRSPQHIFVETQIKNHYSIQTENLSLLCICPQKDSPSLWIVLEQL
ncbi:hypothetical protein Avbf_00135 [Armadillidium vulgare]|nr:hypothetical protein Avbf_00135 [Armadillidium vulgare]